MNSNSETPTQTYIVTWQTVVEMIPTDQATDDNWAVMLAEKNLRNLMDNPEEGDNYFTVERYGSPARRSIVNLADARDFCLDAAADILASRTTGGSFGWSTEK